MSENIPKQLLDGISKNLEVSETVKGEWKNKLADLKKQFLTSQATVYCEDCGLVFYNGSADVVSNEDRFVEWKMLSFRHVWDTRHKVKIYMPFFLVGDAMVKQKNPLFAQMIMRIRTQRLGFDEFGQVCFYEQVEDLRDRLCGSPKSQRSNDENWDVRSRCVCSVCGKSYYDPKDACLCHDESKPWLPMSEVNSINVRRLK